MPSLGQSVKEYLFEDRPLSSFERLAASSNADVIVFGHTHAVEFIRLSYDVERVAAAIRDSELPQEFATALVGKAIPLHGICRAENDQ